MVKREKERERFKGGDMEWSGAQRGKAGKEMGKRVSWRVLAGIWGGCLAARAVHFNVGTFLYFIFLEILFEELLLLFREILFEELNHNSQVVWE